MRRVRYLYGLIFSALLLLVVAGSGLAHRGPSGEPSQSSTVTTSPAANAPWFNIEIDTTYDVGQHVSVAIDPETGIAYASYYDASNQELRLANSSNTYGSCGFYNDWDCLRVYQVGTDIGKYSSIAIDPKGGVGVAYHDATNGQLEYIYFPLPNLAPATKSTIDVGVPSVSTIGLYTSLKYDSDGKPYIAYQFYNYSGVEALMWAYYSVTNGNCGHGGAGSSKVTQDVANIVSQVPATVEALTGVDLISALQSLPGLQPTTVDDSATNSGGDGQQPQSEVEEVEVEAAEEKAE